MEDLQKGCLIWKTPVAERQTHSERDVKIVRGSARAGGDYEISWHAEREINRLDELEKARLTTLLVNLRNQGERQPVITLDVLEEAKKSSPLSAARRADRLLQYIITVWPHVGQKITLYDLTLNQTIFAVSESLKTNEIEFFLAYFEDKRWMLRSATEPAEYVITVEGYSHVEDQFAQQKESAQVFVAMWFHDSMKAAFQEGIAKAITECGYEPRRIDEKPDVRKIDDEIIAEINQSRFIVADFTHEEKGGPRASVYFEVGYAMGQRKEVIYCCRQDCIEGLAFDTHQYAHITWKTSEQLYTGLKSRILALVGHGPLTVEMSN